MRVGGRLRLPRCSRGNPSLRLDEPCPKWQFRLFQGCRKRYQTEEQREAAAEDAIAVEEELVRSSWTR
jgi:hypothetical protein